MDVGTITGLCGLGVAVAGLLYQKFIDQVNRDRAQADKEEKYEHRFTALEQKTSGLDKMQEKIDKVLIMEPKIELFWSNVEAIMAKYAHSPHTPEIDGLLLKVRAKDITPQEHSHLIDLLCIEVGSPCDNPARSMAIDIILEINKLRSSNV